MDVWCILILCYPRGIQCDIYSRTLMGLAAEIG